MTIENARPKNKIFKEESTTKNIYTYMSVAVVNLVMMVASAFLLTAADAPIREAGGYITLIFGAITAWAVAKAMLVERDREMYHEPRHSHNNA